MFFPQPVFDNVGQDSRNHGEDEQQGEQGQSLMREHCQHHESLVAGGRNHHRRERPETEQTAGVERYSGEASDAARNQSESGPEYNLPEARLSDTGEESAVRLDVQGFNHHHHHDDEPRDEYAVAQDVYDDVKNVHPVLLA